MSRVALTATMLMLHALFAQGASAAGCESVLAAQVKGLDTPSRSTTKIEECHIRQHRDRQQNLVAGQERRLEISASTFGQGQDCGLLDRQALHGRRNGNGRRQPRGHRSA
jgi:hypothetical protein